jgi:hypothetical protein
MFLYRSEGRILMISPTGQGPCSRSLCLLSLLLGAQIVLAQKYKPDEPIPSGAQGKVLPVQGKVVEIKGLSLGVVGKAQDLNAALKDLGAPKPPRPKFTLNCRVMCYSILIRPFSSPKPFPSLKK